MKSKQEIGKTLIHLRKQREKTQAEAAKALDISASSLGMYEQGHRIPRDEVKARIAKYYNEPVEKIFFAQ